MIKQISVVYQSVPFIIMDTEGLITAQGKGKEQIDFNELGAYVKILEEQQAAVGEYVSFTKGTYNVNGKLFPAIKIFATSEEPFQPNPTQFLLYKDGVPFAGINELNSLLYSTVIATNAGVTNYNGAMVRFKLPVVNINGKNKFEDDYNTVPLDGVIYCSSIGISAGMYEIVMIMEAQSSRVDFNTKESISVVSATDGIACGYTAENNNSVYKEITITPSKMSKGESTQLIFIHGVRGDQGIYGYNIIQYDSTPSPIATTPFAADKAYAGVDVLPNCVTIECVQIL